MSLHDQHGQKSIEEILTAIAQERDADGPLANYLAKLLSARTAEMVTLELVGTSRTIGASASSLGTNIDRLKQEPGETKGKIETAGKWVSDAAEISARQVSSEVQQLTRALTQASTDLQRASNQTAARCC